MSSQRYFKILGIQPTTDVKVIRKAYYQQAMKYHPDRNPSEEAHQKFIELTEAYESLLLAVQEINRSDNKQENDSSESVGKRRDRDLGDDLAERMRKARERYQEMQRREEALQQMSYEKYTKGITWYWFLFVMGLCLTTSVIFLLDYYVLPTKTTTHYVHLHGMRILFVPNDNVYIDVPFDNGNIVNLPSKLIVDNQDLPFELEKTFLFKDVKRVHFSTTEYSYSLVPGQSVMWTFPLISLVLLMPFFTFLIKGNHLGFTMSYLFCLYVYPIIITVVLFSNYRVINLFVY